MTGFRQRSPNRVSEGYGGERRDVTGIIETLGDAHKKKGKGYEKSEKDFCHVFSHGDGAGNVDDGIGG